MNEHVRLIASELHGYEVDFYAWTQEQSEALRSGRLELADLQNIAEEIESLGKRDRRAVVRQFEKAIVHLLKLSVSTAADSRRGWRRSVMNARRKLETLLLESPSLYARRQHFYEQATLYGIKLAIAELEDQADSSADVLKSIDASRMPFSMTQVLDPDFFPDG